MVPMAVALMEGDDGGLEVLSDGPEARLCAAMGVLNAATAEVVAAIAAALADPAGWRGDGIVTPEHGVALRCGVASARPGPAPGGAGPAPGGPWRSTCGRGTRRLGRSARDSGWHCRGTLVA